MDILGNVGAVNALMRGAAGLVRELKKPSVSKEEFTEILRQEVQKNNSPNKKTAMLDFRIGKMKEWGGVFVANRDFDGSGALNVHESGLTQQVFDGLDLDGNGELTAEEVSRPYVKYLEQQRALAAEEG